VGLRTLLKDLLGDGLVAQELLAARKVGFGVGQVRAREREVGTGLVDRVLERPLVDGEQEVALLDDLAVVEVHAIEIAGDARTHLDGVDRDETANVFVVIDDVALDRGRHRHGRRWRRGLRALALAAGGQHRRENHQDKRGETGFDCHLRYVDCPLRRRTI
jgi:hypothetical protein